MASFTTPATKTVSAENGTTYVYRHYNPSSSKTPLVMHIHFRANLSFWDPNLLTPLVRNRPVITFNNAGVGGSTGEVPTTYQGWADNVIAFVDALGLSQIDLLGFSMGGAAVQMVALTRPGLVRKLVIAGSTASWPAPGSSWAASREREPEDPIKVLATATPTDPAAVQRSLAYSFFYDDDEGRKFTSEYWDRISSPPGASEQPNLNFLDAAKTNRQQRAYMDWEEYNPRNSFERLGELKMPVLVANGDDDVLIPTSRSWELVRRIQNAELIIYPRAGHGFLWQYAELFAEHLNLFFDRDDFVAGGSKL